MSGLNQIINGEGHSIFIDPSANLDGARLRVRDRGCSVHIGAGVTGKWDLTVSQGGSLVIGAGSSCETALVAVQTAQVTIGADCMFSFSVEIRTTDTHAIYDVGTGERVNPDRSVTIGDHVWLAKQVVVLKGASIGTGSIVGTRSLVTGKLPPLSLSAGVPARVVREGVVWTRRVGKGQLDLDAEAMAAISAAQSDLADSTR
jgi:acetyltransferase-like isoleucine patch superfamily enzyme